MATDITELAQKPTRYGTNSQGVFTNQTDGAYVSYLDFMAQAEALERAQQRIFELSEGKVGSALLERENHHVEVVGKLTEHITELESEVEKWKQESESWERVAEKQLATAIELESRTVKLPKLKMLEDYLAEVAIEERKQILVGVKLEFHRACVAAGIKMEVE
ncbi:hypothetical protein [Klebsiella pneumoniae]|uniref:hypothetical protein n=1 Tax=Klebsiella pneumoniae TaxID=573 RepID=UPI002963CA71|nr:hypothetical protein [Klebsiella pneumoniae]MDW1393962.1 hypothetical protein [Klebsiella pneumoniae]